MPGSQEESGEQLRASAAADDKGIPRQEKMLTRRRSTLGTGTRVSVKQFKSPQRTVTAKSNSASQGGPRMKTVLRGRSSPTPAEDLNPNTEEQRSRGAQLKKAKTFSLPSPAVGKNLAKEDCEASRGTPSSDEDVQSGPHPQSPSSSLPAVLSREPRNIVSAKLLLDGMVMVGDVGVQAVHSSPPIAPADFRKALTFLVGQLQETIASIDAAVQNGVPLETACALKPSEYSTIKVLASQMEQITGKYGLVYVDSAVVPDPCAKVSNAGVVGQTGPCCSSTK